MGSPVKRGARYTYQDYQGWPDEERWEIIDGEPYDMTPAPSIKHQRIAGGLLTIFSTFFKRKSCTPFIAPTDVVLDDFNVVQPDLLIVCDKSKITEANIKGVPDLVVEILSPSTSLKDKREKKMLYERFGVQEYITVDPDRELVERHPLVNGEYKSPDVFNWDETLASFAFPELNIPLWEVFDKELPQKGEDESAG